MMVPLALAVATPVASALPPLTAGEVRNADALSLAPRLFGPEVAARAVEGSVRRAWLPGQAYDVVLHEPARPHAGRSCARRTHRVTLANLQARNDDPGAVLAEQGKSTAVGYAPTSPEPASPRRCAGVTGFVYPGARDTEATLRALDGLTGAIAAARGRGALPFTLTCEADAGDTSCENARAALANLPVDKLGSVRFETGHTVPLDLGGPSGQDGSRVRLLRSVPAPDGSPPTPVLGFGGNGRSWSVSLTSREGLLAHVGMRRTMVISH